nr:hypothetical protein BJQ95_03661 [Cryobacterium sp. SO1]
MSRFSDHTDIRPIFCSRAKAFSAVASSRPKISPGTSFWPAIGVMPILPHTVAAVSSVPAREYSVPICRCAAVTARTDASAMVSSASLLLP